MPNKNRPQPDKPVLDEENYLSLMIRIWLTPAEPVNGGAGAWHIEVEHIQSGGHWVLSSEDELRRLVNELLLSLKEENRG